MSRTRKDVPYWVRVNRDSTHTDHDHTRLGKVVYRRVYLYNEDGTPAMHEKPIMRTAGAVVANNGWGKYHNLEPFFWGNRNRVVMFANESGRWHTDIFSEAQRLVAAGRADVEIAVGTQTFHGYETVESYRTHDHCTEGEKFASREQSRFNNRELPCTPELPHEAAWWTYGSTNTRASEHNRYYSYERTRERALSRSLTNRWNSGEDLEDWDEDDVYNKTPWRFIYW